jgi:hypothetical protein
MLIVCLIMSGQRTTDALQRIDQAMRRIEAASARPASSELTTLRSRHARLRAEAQQALNDLEALIGKAGAAA